MTLNPKEMNPDRTCLTLGYSGWCPLSEYDLAYWTPHFSEHLWSPPVYSDALHSRLCRLHNNHTAPCTCTPAHCRWENGSMHIPPMEMSFSHQT